MKPGSSLFLYGMHACLAALKNPERTVEKVFVTNSALADDLPLGCLKVEVVDKKVLEGKLPTGAVHQGIALQVQPLPLYDISDLQALQGNACVVLLDQVSDPHNVGAIIRSAAVFGASCVIVPERCAPKETGVLAKSASGALEIVPMCVVKNLSQAIKALQEFGFWTVGFAETGHQTLNQIDLRGKIALILGAEGDGMRRLTKEMCDFSVRLPTTENFSTLNVSNAAAIALYERFKQAL